MRLYSHPRQEPFSDKLVLYTHSPSVRVRPAGIAPWRSFRKVRSRQDTRLGPGITSEAVLEVPEYVRMTGLEAIVLVSPVGGVLA